MLSPILYDIGTFDASVGTVVRFYYTGEQVFANRLIIKNNETLAEVYNEKIDSMQLSHSVPENILANGTTYSATITVFDKNDNESPASNIILFTCYTTPLFSISNINEGDIINDTSYPVALTYSQAEGIALNQYIVTLYDYGHNSIYSSGAIYGDSSLTVTISGLQDNESYYIRATAETVAGMSVDTGYIGFSVDVIAPNTFLVLSLENIPEESSIKVSSNVVIVEGRNEGDLSYIDDKAVDLTNGSKVIFDDGFLIKDKFTIGGIWQHLVDYSTIMIIPDGNSCITVTWNKGDFGDGDVYYAELIASTYINSSWTMNYVIQSNSLTLSSPDALVAIQVQKSYNLFNLVISEWVGGVLS